MTFHGITSFAELVTGDGRKCSFEAMITTKPGGGGEAKNIPLKSKVAKDDGMDGVAGTLHCTYLVPEDAKVLIIPIARTVKKKPPCGKTDWAEQLAREGRGEQMMWDDAATNKCVAGDILCV